jgi:hypothetical protein
LTISLLCQRVRLSIFSRNAPNSVEMAWAISRNSRECNQEFLGYFQDPAKLDDTRTKLSVKGGGTSSMIGTCWGNLPARGKNGIASRRTKVNHLSYRDLLRCVAYTSAALVISPCLLAQTAIATSTVGGASHMLSLMQSANKDHLANWFSSNVSVIDGTTNAVTKAAEAGNHANNTIAAINLLPTYTSPPIVNILQVEPQGPTLYPALYRGVVQGNILYVTEQDNVNGNSNLVLIDISSAGAPTITSQTPGSGPGMNGIVVLGQYVYVSYYQSSVVQVFDASNPYSLASVGSITTSCGKITSSGLYGSLVVAGSYLYTPCPGGFIDVLSIANPTSPIEVGVITAQNLTNPTSLAVSGQTLFASEPSESDNDPPGVYYSAVCAYSLASGPIPTVPIACATVGHSPQNIAVQGTTVAASIGDDNQLDTIDFSNMASPAVYRAALDPNVCVHPFVENMVAFQGTTVFVGCSNSSHPSGPGYGVEVVDVTNIVAPTLLGTMFGSPGSSFAMIVPNGSYLYLGGYPGQDGNPSSTAGALYTVESGMGTNQDDVTFLPTNVSFANQAVGTASAAQSVTLSVSGPVALTIYGITIAGSNPGDFAQTNTCGSTVAAGANCTINVTFMPTAAGARSASLIVSDNASGSPQTLSLSGTGTTVQATSGVLFDAIGSSALYLETGQAAAQDLQTQISGTNYQCLWTGGSGALVATDPTTGQPENGQSWIAWSIDTADGGNSCANPGTSPKIYSYLQTDSVVGVRCLFNGCVITNNASGGATHNAIFATPCTPDGYTPNEEVCTLPASIAGFWGSGLVVNVAGTDIRPEDAYFATERALTPCGTPVVPGSQYLGLGYASPSSVQSEFSTSVLNIAKFSLPSSYTVYRLGAVPVVVAVNETDANGFANRAITNINSSVLAGFLDGTLSKTEDISGITTGSEGITVLIREPVSGTYNTMEYNVPNNMEIRTSQDVGESQQAAQVNCTGTMVQSNPMHIATIAGYRSRVIGTGEMLNALFGGSGIATPPNGAILGYAFWSTQNFKNAYSGSSPYNTNARYLTVDGVDPLLNSNGPYPGSAGPCVSGTCPAGTIPTPGNGGLGSVTLSNVADGSYPIWSFLRLVCKGSGTSAACTAANALTTAGQSFVTFGGATSIPDFVPISSATVVRSHFLPPGITVHCGIISNGTAVSDGGATEGINEPECGGDVDGVVLTIQGDMDYIIAYQAFANTSRHTGQTGLRR